MANPCLNPKLSDFCGYPFIEYKRTKTEIFFRNNCGSGQTGSGVSYSKTYSTYLGEDQLEQMILNDVATFNAEGQANANSQGTCATNPGSGPGPGPGPDPGPGPLPGPGCRADRYTKVRYYPKAMTAGYVLVGHAAVRLSRSDFMSSNLVDGNAVANRGPWYTVWPHNDYTDFISLENHTSSGPIQVYGRRVTISGSDDACKYPTMTLLWETPYNDSHGTWVDSTNSLYLPNGVLMVMKSDAWGTLFAGERYRKVHLRWWNTLTNEVTHIVTFQHPNGETNYGYNDISLVYNGSDSVYVMMSFKSPNNKRRTRTGFFRISMLAGIPTGVVQTLQGYRFSNQRLHAISGVRAGNRIFFMYTEDGSWKFAPMEGSAPANTGAFVGDKMLFMRDPINTHLAFGGTVARQGLLQYNSTTNTWTVIKTDG